MKRPKCKLCNKVLKVLYIRDSKRYYQNSNMYYCKACDLVQRPLILKILNIETALKWQELEITMQYDTLNYDAKERMKFRDSIIEVIKKTTKKYVKKFSKNKIIELELPRHYEKGTVKVKYRLEET